MPKNKGKVRLPRRLTPIAHAFHLRVLQDEFTDALALQGGKNRRRGKNENDNEKRELVFAEEGQVVRA